MSQVLSTIGGALSGPVAQNIAKIAQPVTGILGTIGNINNSRRQGQVSSTAASQQQDLANLSKNPALLAARIRALQQPLSSGLTADVGNETQALLGERGLSNSPQIAQQILAQALAPYQLQEQGMAQNALFQALGLGPSSTNAAAGSIPGQIDTSNFWKQFFPQQQGSISVPGGYGSTPYPGSITDSGGGPPTVDQGVLGGGTFPNPSDYPGSDTPPDFNPFNYGTGF